MAANMRGPKPVDPLWYRADCTLEVRCGCGNRAKASIRAWIVWNRLNDNMTLYEMQARLRCLNCGRRSPRIEIDDLQ